MQCGELQLLGSSFYFQQTAESSTRGNKDPDSKLLLSFSEEQQLWQRYPVLIGKLYREFHNRCLFMLNCDYLSDALSVVGFIVGLSSNQNNWFEQLKGKGH